MPPIDSSIPLRSTAVIDPSQGLNALASAFQYRDQKERQAKLDTERTEDRAQQNELRSLQIASERFKTMDERDQRRLKSTILGAAQLDGYLQAGDVEGAKGFLQSRRQTIEQAKTIDPSLDTRETDQAIQMLESGKVDQLKGVTQNSIKLGQALKFLERPEGQTGFTLGPGQVRYGPDGRTIAQAPAESKLLTPEEMAQRKELAIAGRQPRQETPYYQFLPTAEGYLAGNARTGTALPLSVGGRTPVRATDSPVLQGQIAQAKEAGRTFGEETTKAALDMPRTIDNAKTALRLSNELLAHPGFKQAVGASSLTGIQKIPGTDARDFMSRQDQLKGGAFLEAFNTLKGGGQITEVEGKKATDAIARMDNATSELEYRSAVKDYQDVIKMGIARAERKSARGAAIAPSSMKSDAVTHPDFPGFSIQKR